MLDYLAFTMHGMVTDTWYDNRLTDTLQKETVIDHNFFKDAFFNFYLHID